MKKLLFAFSLVFLAAACNSNMSSSQQNQAANVSKTQPANPCDHSQVQNISTQALNLSWQASNIKYNINQAYLTPDIADYGCNVVGIDRNRTHFLVLHLNLRNSNISGAKIEIPASQYVRLQAGSSTLSPDGDYVFLAPQENGTMYMTFAVGAQYQSFTLLTGPLDRPRSTVLDFSNQPNIVRGIMLVRQGFQPAQ